VIGQYALAMGFIVLGGALIFWSVLQVRRAKQSLTWPTVTGIITQANLEDVTLYREPGKIEYRQPQYKVNVRYNYKVGRRKYTNDKLLVGGVQWGKSHGKAHGMKFQYSSGEEVEVYYNPSNPQDSCLETRQEGAAILIGVGLIFFCVGVLIGWGDLILKNFI